MKRKRRFSRNRRAVSGIISATILFTMLFTTGTTYFLFVSLLDQQRQIATVKRAEGDQLQRFEKFEVGGRLVANNVGFFLNNTGGVAMTVVSVFLSNSTFFKFMNGSNQEVTPRLPITINPGGSLNSFDTAVAEKSGSLYTIKVLSERGNVAAGFWPFLTVTLETIVRAAILAQGAGFLALDFNSFRAYNTTGTAPGCNPSTAGCQLTPWPSGVAGYTLKSPQSTGRYIVFSANVTNVDPEKRDLTIDTDSVLVQFLKPTTGGGTARGWSWGIGKVNATGHTQAYSAISISYLQTVTLYFIVIPSTNTQTYPASGDFNAVFIYLHGNVASTTYGQNIPFVTTKYT